MSDRQPPAQRMNISFSSSDVKIEKASLNLKRKAGDGGFDPRAIAMAERRLSAAKDLFPKIAAGDIDVITYALSQLEHATQTKEWFERMQWAAAELKANSVMFQYPLVARVAESLCEFFELAGDINLLGREVISLHLKALQIAMEKGSQAVTEEDEVELLSGLAKASMKALQGNN